MRLDSEAENLLLTPRCLRSQHGRATLSPGQRHGDSPGPGPRARPRHGPIELTHDSRLHPRRSWSEPVTGRSSAPRRKGAAPPAQCPNAQGDQAHAGSHHLLYHPRTGPRRAWATEPELGRSPGGAPASAVRPDRTHAPGSGHHRGGAATPARCRPPCSCQHRWRPGPQTSRLRPPTTTAPATPAAPQSPWWLPRPGCLCSSCFDHPDPAAPAHRPPVCNLSTPPAVSHATRVRPCWDPSAPRVLPRAQTRGR
jgi:hypothetical protein